MVADSKGKSDISFAGTFASSAFAACWAEVTFKSLDFLLYMLCTYTALHRIFLNPSDDLVSKELLVEIEFLSMFGFGVKEFDDWYAFLLSNSNYKRGFVR